MKSNFNRLSISSTVLFTAVLLFCTPLRAQDSHLSQFDASPIFLNPGLTGMYSGDYQVYLNYRNQWSAVGTKPWVTSAISYDRPHRRFGFGGMIMNNRAGGGGFNIFNFILSGAYEITQDPKLYNHLSVGLQLGFIQKSFNPANYIFDNQYSSLDGGGFDNNLPNGEEQYFTNTSVWLPESNIGIYYYNTNTQKKMRPFGGMSFFHLTAPKETFMGSVNNLPRRFNAHGGMEYDMKEGLMLKPLFLFMMQKNVYEIKFGVLAYYVWSSKKTSKTSETILIFGPTYRNNDAVVLHFGMIYNQFEYRISYDVNTSSLNKVSKYRGGFEISIVYRKPSTRRQPSLEID